MYKEGDDIDNIKIVQDGIAMFLQIGYNNQAFAIIDPKRKSLEALSMDEADGIDPKILSWCGYEDSVVNHINLVYDMLNPTISRE
jgi:hypothetical protein